MFVCALCSVAAVVPKLIQLPFVCLIKKYLLDLNIQIININIHVNYQWKERKGFDFLPINITDM